ncbi:UDP-glucose 4-epimerase GalE, partial [Staphylococcus saprophyticus]
YNLGTGKGISVLEMVNSFTSVTDVPVPYRLGARRAGDLPAFWADASKAQKELNWVVEKGVDDMMIDTWRWQSGNPEGYS